MKKGYFTKSISKIILKLIIKITYAHFQQGYFESDTQK